MSDWKWLESTRELQEKVYHYDYPLMRFEHEKNPYLGNTTQLTRYLDWNTTAAVQELAEVREEFSWKPWATDRAFYNRDRVRDEVIDVMHFLGNILTSIGVTDQELEEHYQLKQTLNRNRQASGTYSARKGGLAAGSDNG